MPVSPDVTQLLLDLSAGHREVLDRLLPPLYAELRGIAHRHLRRERDDHTLNTTALVHEAYLKLVDQSRVRWQNRAHFYAVAATVMRRILLDHAKAHRRGKRGGGLAPTVLDDALVPTPERAEALVALDEALARLARLDAQQARVVECRYFGGLTVEETAEALGVSPATVKRDWAVAKAWLYREMRRDLAA